MATTSPPPAADADRLRVVLFGMPDAGKSSLLGALAQAAHTQERALHGRLADPSHGLDDLRRRLYDERPRETLEEIVPYPVTYEPFEAGVKLRPESAVKATLIDCDGRVANELLTRRKALDEGDPADSLGAAVLAADALILVVDAAAGPEQIDADFAEFVRFLKLVRRERVRRSEIGGLPVFLVLSKCDLLAQPGDTAAAWDSRIDERQSHVRERFEEFLKGDDDDDDDDRLPFGAIDLHVTATAVKRPALTGTPAAEREPYGVAELFRDGLEAAKGFRDRARRSQTRLFWTAGGVAALVTVMVLAAVFFATNRQSAPSSALEGKIDNYRAREGPTASTRLAEPLQRKLSELTEYKNDRDFAKLPSETQAYVNQRQAELQAYQEYKDRFRSARAPAEALGPDELDAIDKRLRDELAPPKDYRDEWGQTDAVKLRDKWLEDIPALRAAAAEVEDWYRKLRQDGTDLLLSDRPGTTTAWPVWTERLNNLLAKAARPPFRDTDRLPNTTSLPFPLGAAPTYAAVLNYLPVARARSDWEQTRQSLERLRDLAAALGLTGEANAPLRIPGQDFTVAQAGDRLQTLKKSYPRYTEWSLASLPEAVQTPVRRAAEAAYQNLVKAGQDAILARLQQGDGRETRERWLAVADWVVKAPELADWRELVAVAGRLADPRGEDPVPALAGFLRRDRFDLEIRRVRVTIPDNLAADRLSPAGDLTVYLRPPGDGGETTTLALKRDPEVVRDSIRGTSTYTFVTDGPGKLTYRPGDLFWADLPLRDPSGRDWKLTWTKCRSLTYQFERLTRAPRLHRAGQDSSSGTSAEDVTTVVLPEGGIPKVPDLLPVVPVKR
jgi:hypothetical protein